MPISSSEFLLGPSLSLGEGKRWGTCVWVGGTPEAGGVGGEEDSTSLGGWLGPQGLQGMPESSQ